jgi:hypothetical protein
LSDHLIEKGPSFKEAIDARIDAVTGQVTVRSVNKDGKKDVHAERMDLPADLANGLLLSVLKDIPVDIPKSTLSLLATGPKPRLVTLEITPEGDDAFSVGTIHRKATNFRVKIKIGGIAGVVAPSVGNSRQTCTSGWSMAPRLPSSEWKVGYTKMVPFGVCRCRTRPFSRVRAE